ncbi:FAD-dependent oxidoreductase, partial [Streptosporangium sandarakinum]
MSDSCCGPTTIAIEQVTASRQATSGWRDDLPVAVIGAGPIGLAAAAHLAERGIDFLVLEAGEQIAASIAQWGHVRVFSPWKYNIDAAARRLLEAGGWTAPDLEWLPTGAEIISEYLAPLAKLFGDRVRTNARVTAISRLGYDRVRTAGREEAPFLIRLADGGELQAGAIIDASGTYTSPNVLGASGLPAHGEDAAADAIDHALPDVLGADRHRYEGRRVLVVGAGHSAATTLLALAQLDDTPIAWAVRAGSAGRAYGGGDADALPARGTVTGLAVHLEPYLQARLPGPFTWSYWKCPKRSPTAPLRRSMPPPC